MHPSEYLYYYEKENKTDYSSIPQGCLDPIRLVQGKPCWAKLVAGGVKKQKTLILADWWAESWGPMMRSEVKVLLAELLHEGFKIYLWLKPKFCALLDDIDINFLDNIDIFQSINECDLSQITPEFKDVLTHKAMEQLKLTKDQLAIVQRVELEKLLGRNADDSKTIDARYLINTSHPIPKIKEVEASQSIPFESALIDELSCKGNDRPEWAKNWEGIQVMTVSQELKLTNTSQHIPDTYHPTYVCLNTTNPCTPEMINQLFTPALKGLNIEDHSTLPMIPQELVNLKYLSFERNFSLDDTDLAIIKASNVRDLRLSVNELSLLLAKSDGQHVNDLANSLTQVTCLTLNGAASEKEEVEFILQHPMPKLNSLTLNHVDLTTSFRCQYPLDKLHSITVYGHCTINGLESLMQSAVNCHQLTLRDCSFLGNFSLNFHLAKLTSLTLAGCLDESDACRNLQILLRSAPALTTLHIFDTDIETFALSLASVQLPQLK